MTLSMPVCRVTAMSTTHTRPPTPFPGDGGFTILNSSEDRATRSQEVDLPDSHPPEGRLTGACDGSSPPIIMTSHPNTPLVTFTICPKNRQTDSASFPHPRKPQRVGEGRDTCALLHSPGETTRAKSVVTVSRPSASTRFPLRYRNYDESINLTNFSSPH